MINLPAPQEGWFKTYLQTQECRLKSADLQRLTGLRMSIYFFIVPIVL